MNDSSSKKQPVVLLLALWGESYILNFFDFGLRSLLAPGNIPALCNEYDCTFLFLTKRSDIAHFKSQPAYQQLCVHCKIEFIDISDFIFEGNYSATLTLAYERGMRSRGTEMCETYFFYLVSDYIMADGSLKNITKYLKAGYSGITTGNFLVVEEYIAHKLQKRIEEHPEGLLAIPAQEMLALGFPHLHPVSQAHMVSHGFTHATHGNRLFWKVNDHVMIGRFYLRHMLCIKPELDNYILGSSCDYSFIPEMCPSGNVKHIQDSDDYCLIEMAPFNYEQDFISRGGYDIPSVAERLSKWTTAVHRANAHIPVIYHSTPLSKPPLEALQESADFVKAIEQHLAPTPQPIRGHYYWLSCIESILYHIMEKKITPRYIREKTLAGVVGSPTFFPAWSNAADDRAVLSLTNPPPSLPISLKQQRKIHLHKKIAGISPNTSFWHIHWFDDYLVKGDIQKQMANKDECVVIACEPISEIVHWMESHYPNRCTYQLYHLLAARGEVELNHVFHNKKNVLIWISEDHFSLLGNMIRQCAKYLPSGSVISVYVKHKTTYSQNHLKQIVAICSADLFNVSVTCEHVQPHYSIPHAKWSKAAQRFAKRSFAPKKHLWTRIMGFGGLAALGTACTFANLACRLGATSKKKETSAILNFRRK